MPPTIEVDSPTQIKLMEGDDYALPCNARGIPNPHTSWRRDGQAITEENNGKLSVIIFCDYLQSLRLSALVGKEIWFILK